MGARGSRSKIIPERSSKTTFIFSLCSVAVFLLYSHIPLFSLCCAVLLDISLPKLTDKPPLKEKNLEDLDLSKGISQIEEQVTDVSAFAVISRSLKYCTRHKRCLRMNTEHKEIVVCEV